MHGPTGAPGYLGSSGWAGTPPEDKIITITNRDIPKKIKVKVEKVEPEWTEVKSSPVFEMTLRAAKTFFYGILGIKVKGAKSPEVPGKLKRIK
jgi:hypothetical protein